jgi:hypothetical protein
MRFLGSQSTILISVINLSETLGRERYYSWVLCPRLWKSHRLDEKPVVNINNFPRWWVSVMPRRLVQRLISETMWFYMCTADCLNMRRHKTKRWDAPTLRIQLAFLLLFRVVLSPLSVLRPSRFEEYCIAWWVARSLSTSIRLKGELLGRGQDSDVCHPDAGMGKIQAVMFV